ncbi:DNA helicase protein [Dioscorea alata]|uniref:DNA helicase protein n=1 Tax=Dioscorea alata TaxID=55571 RepID=A0ACB7VA56_DIOAL|nr:DNA helicase protein [Dioscorea alata]
MKNQRIHWLIKKIEGRKNEKEKSGQTSKNVNNPCYRCGGKGHWSRTCRTPKHLIELYQESLKNKKKKIKTNFSYKDDLDHGHIDDTYLNIVDFLIDPEEKINHLIGDGSMI